MEFDRFVPTDPPPPLELSDRYKDVSVPDAHYPPSDAITSDTEDDVDTADTLPDLSAEEASPDSYDVEAFLGSLYPMDGTQPEINPDEQKAAGALVAECVAGYHQKVRTIPDIFNPSGRSSTEYRHGTSGRRYTITAKRANDDHIPLRVDVTTSVVVCEMQRDNNGKGVLYEIARDGIARRTDLSSPTDALAEARKEALLGIVPPKPWHQMTLAELRSYQDMLQQRIALHSANREAEERFGLRRQPIGLAEARRLVALILGQRGGSPS
ncbi:MAG TPA: hypothetical protein VFM05_15410 [Candidatus Saccharimonadales bacterium]|nr:hypothetical protein [Candidatus Saccharimonadales bacterium]